MIVAHTLGEGSVRNVPQALGTGPALRAPALHAKVSENAKSGTEGSGPGPIFRPLRSFARFPSFRASLRSLSDSQSAFRDQQVIRAPASKKRVA